jgi:hypothetical protein
MKRVLLVSAVLTCLAAAVFALTRRGGISNTNHRDHVRTNVTVSAAADDGKETYRLQLFEPWNEAEYRIVLLAGACVDSDGLPSLHTFRTLDSSLGAGGVSLRGVRSVFNVRPSVDSWAQVTSQADLVVSVTDQ